MKNDDFSTYADVVLVFVHWGDCVKLLLSQHWCPVQLLVVMWVQDLAAGWTVSFDFLKKNRFTDLNNSIIRQLWACYKHVTRHRGEEEENRAAGGFGSTLRFYQLSLLRDCSRVEHSEHCVPMHCMQIYP